MARSYVVSELNDGVVGRRTVRQMGGVEGVVSGAVGVYEVVRRWQARGFRRGGRGFGAVVTPVMAGEAVRENAWRRVRAGRGEVRGRSAEWSQRHAV